MCNLPVYNLQLQTALIYNHVNIASFQQFLFLDWFTLNTWRVEIRNFSTNSTDSSWQWHRVQCVYIRPLAFRGSDLCVLQRKHARTSGSIRTASRRQGPGGGWSHLQGMDGHATLEKSHGYNHCEMITHTVRIITAPRLQLVAFEFENFLGKKVELSVECKDVSEKAERIGSVIVECGPWVIRSNHLLSSVYTLFI